MSFVTSRSTLDTLMGPALRTSTPGETLNTPVNARPLRDLRMRSESNLLRTATATATAAAIATEEKRLQRAYQQQLRNFSRPLPSTDITPTTQPPQRNHGVWQMEDLHAAQPRRRSSRHSLSGGRRNRSMIELSRRRSSLAPVVEVASPCDERPSFLMEADLCTALPVGQAITQEAAAEIAGPFPHRIHHPEPLTAFTRVPHRTASSSTAEWLVRHHGSGKNSPRIATPPHALAMDQAAALHAATLSPEALAECLDALTIETPQRPAECVTPGLVASGGDSTDDNDSLAESTESATSSVLPATPTPAATKKHVRRASLTGDLWRGLKKAF